MIQWMLIIWSLVPLPFLKPAWTSGSSQFIYCWSLAWRILTITSLVWDECNCAVICAFFGIAFLWDWDENCPFPVLWPLLSFPNLLAYWVQHFHSRGQNTQVTPPIPGHIPVNQELSICSVIPQAHRADGSGTILLHLNIQNNNNDTIHWGNVPFRDD